ncbi:MAG TPA: cupin domain-containing protein [Acidocella sp.]|jgi:quercetin dioxygenase-like cupin family protein|nr:cupin domain-containing protein [Acidocella sp.]
MTRLQTDKGRRSFTGRSVAMLGLAMLAAAPGRVFAAACPAGKSGVGVRPENHTPGAGVTDTVLTSIDLAKQPVHIDGRLLRLRKLVVQPGGVVPWHSHANRPAIIYIISGTIKEYASTCSVPIVHGPGDVTAELSSTSHWWKNTGSEPVVLLSADLFPETTGNPHMM